MYEKLSNSWQSTFLVNLEYLVVSCACCYCCNVQVRCLRPDLAASADLYSKVEIPTHKQRVGIRCWLLDERTHTFCIGPETDDRPRSQVAWRLKAEVDRDAKPLGQGGGPQPQQPAGTHWDLLSKSGHLWPVCRHLGADALSWRHV